MLTVIKEKTDTVNDTYAEARAEDSQRNSCETGKKSAPCA